MKLRLQLTIFLDLLIQIINIDGMVWSDIHDFLLVSMSSKQELEEVVISLIRLVCKAIQNMKLLIPTTSRPTTEQYQPSCTAALLQVATL